MLGLSLSKVLFTILVIVAVWKGFSWVGRMAQERRQTLAQGARRPARRPGGRTVELERCERCGAYVDPREGCSCRSRG